MKNLAFFLVLTISNFFNEAVAQNPYWNTIIIKGSIRPLTKNYSILLSEGGRTRPGTTWDTPAGSLCSFFIRKGAKNARLEINTPGFKRYSLNIPNLNFQRDTMYINIGIVNLIESELPRIERIIASKAKDRSTHFEVTLRNPLMKEFLFQELGINAFKEGDGSLCCCPPAAIFTIGENLQINGGNKLEKKVNGTFRELVRGKDYIVGAEGSIIRNGCTGAEALNLTLPTSILLPPHQFTAIHIILPEHFSLKDSAYSYPSISEKPKKSLIGDGEVRRFNSFHFKFRTSKTDELEIEGSCEAGHLRLFP